MNPLISRKKQKRQERLKAMKMSEGKECKKCGACCEVMDFEIAPPTPDLERYYNIHENTRVTRREGRTYVEIRNTCKHLTADNLCGIQETKPDICRLAYNKKREGVIFMEGCAFK